jgi:DNA-binding CsgD family transcriptional regulator
MEEYLTYHKNSALKLEETYKNICTQLAIEQFGYLRVYKDSKYIFVSSDVKSVNDHVVEVGSANIYYQSFLGSGNICGEKCYFNIWPEIPETHSMQVFAKNCWNGFHAVLPNDGYVEIWYGASSPLNASINSLYQQENFRQKFLISVDYFNKQKALLLDQFDEKYMPQFSEGFDFGLPIEDEICKVENFHKERDNLLKCYYPKGISIKSKNGISKLTATEILILGFLAQGYSSKQVASIIGNSPKTIEFHKEHLRLKTGYNIKSDLIKMYNDQIKFLVE